jgi:hypothetical protein
MDTTRRSLFGMLFGGAVAPRLNSDFMSTLRESVRTGTTAIIFTKNGAPTPLNCGNETQLDNFLEDGYHPSQFIDYNGTLHVQNVKVYD